ncbi:MAG: MerR family transcriptional regulator [Bacillota bacterium]
MKIREFAQRSGVTVRTLLHYDKLGLLKPSQRTDAGYRVYCDDDFLKLQQILTLKFIGLSLTEIRELLDKKTTDILGLINLQKKALKEKKKYIETVINTLEMAEIQIQVKGFLDVEQLLDIIKVTCSMEKRIDFIQQYFSNDQLKEVASRLYGNKTKEEMELKVKEGIELYNEIKASLHLDPASPKAQELARRWKADMDEFAQGDPEVVKNLTAMYKSLEKAPKEVTGDWSPQIFEFINRALEMYNNKE